MSSRPKILLTGATGYIGGSILATLMSTQPETPGLKDVVITCLVRGEQRAERLRSQYGERVHPVVYNGAEEIEATTALAAQQDIIINTTLTFDPNPGTALVHGLAQRKAATGRDVWMMHTSGTSNLADQPVSRKYLEPTPLREFDDAKDNVYAYEKKREEISSYPQRTAEMAVIDTGLELGVKTLVIMSPTIYGRGTGLFNKASIQIPSLTRAFVELGHGAVIGDGSGVWDHVHVADLSELYKIVLLQILVQEGKNLPVGKHGIIFAENGRHSWLDLSQTLSDVLYEQGKIKSANIDHVGFGDATKVLSKHLLGAPDDFLEMAIASSARTLATVGRNLGWQLRRGISTWKQDVPNDINAVL